MLKSIEMTGANRTSSYACGRTHKGQETQKGGCINAEEH